MTSTLSLTLNDTRTGRTVTRSMRVSDFVVDHPLRFRSAVDRLRVAMSDAIHTPRKEH